MCRAGLQLAVCVAVALVLTSSSPGVAARRTNARAGALVARSASANALTDGNVMAAAVDEHLGSHAQLIAHINRVAARMRVEQHRRVVTRAGAGAGGAGGTYCKTLLSTQVKGFVNVLLDSLAPLADWLPLPANRKAVSVFLQGETSAKAFVGIEANIGMGFEIASDPPVAPATEPVKTARLFACLGAAVSTGHFGATAMFGVGVVVGFGRFKDTVLDSNAEIAVELGLGVHASVAILLKTPEAKDAITAWNAWRTSKIGAQAQTPASTKTWIGLAKSVATGGVSAVDATFRAALGMVQGVHLAGGMGAGADLSVDVSADLGISKYIAEKLPATFPLLTQKWIKTKNAFVGLGKKIIAAGAKGAKKLVTKWTPGAVTDVHAATDAATDDFEEAELTEAEMEAVDTAVSIMGPGPNVAGGRREAFSADPIQQAAASAAAVISKQLPPSAPGERRGAFSA